MDTDEQKVRLKWLESAGGPLILLPQELLQSWEGVSPPSGGRVIEAHFRWRSEGPATDYDRAVDVGDLIGVIPVGTGRGLVLGDEPLRTTWLPHPEHPHENGFLVRWVSAESEDAVLRALARVATNALRSSELLFSVASGNLILFDSAIPGNELLVNENEHLRINLRPGEYVVRTGECVPNDGTCLILHQFQNK